MINVKLTTNNGEIISTGSVIISANRYVEFQIQKLNYRIAFILEANKDGTLTESRVINETIEAVGDTNKRVDITFVNYSELVMATPSSEIKVGIIDDRSLLLNFAIRSLNYDEGKSKLFHYTWILSDEKA